MQTRWSIGLILGLCVGLASAQVNARWHDLYGADGYVVFFNALQRDANGDLYALITLRQPEGNDGVALIRYNPAGQRLGVEAFGLNNAYQEYGVDFYLASNGELILLCGLYDPPQDSSNFATLIIRRSANGQLSQRPARGIPVGFFAQPNLFAFSTDDDFTLNVNQSGFGIGNPAVRNLAFRVNPHNRAYTVSGWTIGRRGWILQGGLEPLTQSDIVLSQPFSYVADAVPLSPTQNLYIWGAATENGDRMYGPDGIEGERVELRVGYGANNAVYVYILCDNTLYRIDPTTQTRMWARNIPSRQTVWTVDSQGRVHLLGIDSGGRALWRVEPDGSVQRFAFRLPQRVVQELWWLDDLRLFPLNRGRWIVAASGSRYDTDYGIYLPSHSFVGLFALPGDTDGDGCVDEADMLNILINFGGGDPNADLNSDGVVDDADLLEVLFHFGSGC